MAIPNVGKCFPTAEGFLAYLESLQFGAWRPRFVTMHHTGAPDLKTWRGWQTRAKPVTDEQWLKNLAVYYGNPPLGWSAGPHFFFTPNNFCVLSAPTARGVHAVSFNAMSWGVECVGDFDREPFDGVVRDKYVEGLACLHIAAGLQIEPFEKKVRGLHFHRDDPKTNKTCPGTKVLKPELTRLVQAKIDSMTGGDHPAEQINQLPISKNRHGVVNSPDDLNVRAAASAKAPIVKSLKNGAALNITGESMNGDTKWFAVDGGFVSSRYVTLSA